jgi:cyclophilin family peptidyl-prolyl cis-trans isomerase
MSPSLKIGIYTLIFLICFRASGQDTGKFNQMVLVSTEYGDIKLRLYDETPLHRNNFMALAYKGFFDSTLFHRVINTFMIQGGDPLSRTAGPGVMLGNGDVGYRIPAEIRDTIFHKKGVLAAARDNNPQMASSGCQFYIVQGKVFSDAELDMIETRMGKKLIPAQRKIYTTVGGTPHLDGTYTVFGEVVQGLEVVDKIAAVQKDATDRPLKDIRMKVSLINN